MSKVIVMASGGVESNTLIARLSEEGHFVIGLFFDLGLDTSDQQFHCAKQALNSEHGRLERVDIRGLKETFLEFIPPDQIMGEADKICPDVEFLPIYTSIAAYYAESCGLRQVYIGFTKDQMTKQRSKFLRLIGTTLATYQEGLTAVSFEVPYATLSKANVVTEGNRLGVDYSKSWSCIYGRLLHCGVCERCKARKAAFSDAKLPDQTAYAK